MRADDPFETHWAGKLSRLAILVSVIVLGIACWTGQLELAFNLLLTVVTLSFLLLLVL